MESNQDLASLILSRFNINLEPCSLSREEVIDKIKGTIYGQAIGDAIGLRAEFFGKEQAMELCKNGLYGYEEWERDRHRSMWDQGDWSDDTDQMLLILIGYLENRTVDASDFAKRLKEWMDLGIPEISKRPSGSGYTVSSTTKKDIFERYPHLAAVWTWLALGCGVAANGGVMRTSILGIIQYNDLSKVLRNTIEICKVTHSDPRCVASCVAVTTAITMMLRGYSLDNIKPVATELSCITLSSSLEYLEKDIQNLKSVQFQAHPQDLKLQKILDFLHKKFTSLKESIQSQTSPSELLQHMNLSTLEDTKFDGETYGYTYLSLAAGYHSLYHFQDFREGILNVIRQGGDTDTNAAVAGALLGCKLGFNQLPVDLIQGLNRKEWLDIKIESLIEQLWLD